MHSSPPEGPLADYQAIAAVSETIRRIIDDKVNASLGASAVLSDLVEGMPPTSGQVTVFLFEIVEDVFSRNRPHSNIANVDPNAVDVRKPEMPLLLRYLITAWGQRGLQDAGGRKEEQKMLATVLQTFYDQPILSGAILEPPLDAEQHNLKVTLSPLSLEERSRVWYAVQQPYRLSLSYEVRVVNLSTTVGATRQRVRERVSEPAVGGSR